LTLLQIHIVAASGWLGLVAAETVIELMAKDRAIRQFVANVHKTIDLYFEGPRQERRLSRTVIWLLRAAPVLSPLGTTSTAAIRSYLQISQDRALMVPIL
jgi:hypothetical protein